MLEFSHFLSPPCSEGMHMPNVRHILHIAGIESICQCRFIWVCVWVKISIIVERDKEAKNSNWVARKRIIMHECLRLTDILAGFMEVFLYIYCYVCLDSIKLDHKQAATFSNKMTQLITQVNKTREYQRLNQHRGNGWNVQIWILEARKIVSC